MFVAEEISMNATVATTCFCSKREAALKAFLSGKDIFTSLLTNFDMSLVTTY